MTSHIGHLLIVGLLLGADTEDASVKEHARFEGVWRFALVEVNGVKQADAPFESNKLMVLKDGRFIIVQSERITHGNLKLDPTTTPKNYDVTVTNGPRKGTTSYGIYEAADDSYKICLPLRGKERPKILESKPDSGTMVHVFKREKFDVKEAIIVVGRKELVGNWQAVSYSLDGKRATDEDMKKFQLVIDVDGKAVVRNEGKVFIACATQIDPTQNPMTIDMMFTEGDSKGKTSFGIYRLEDDVLTICGAAPGNVRPTEFNSKSGSGHTLMTYKRMDTATK